MIKIGDKVRPADAKKGDPYFEGVVTAIHDVGAAEVQYSDELLWEVIDSLVKVD